MATICIATKNNEDDQEEICCTNIGIVSGVGSIELLEPVNAKFNQIVELSSSDGTRENRAQGKTSFLNALPASSR